MEKNDIVNRVLELLEGGRFEKWYGPGGNFDRYVTGDMKHEDKITHTQAKEKICEELTKLLGL
jgi:hypothetical protein